ncbi:three-Cys-motif partner protein TcmP [Streptomyces niveus]|uniref:three-Cys-motif partner protein TcmP n=1 Tax=Streptomyces niveus TaxID=193462 RepID=UPI0033F61064
MFKHELLRQYLPQFGGMTGSHSHDKRVVYLDGYAGEGRYENGDPASAEIALRIASHPGSKHGLTLDCFFTEAQATSFEPLNAAVQLYAGRGVPAHAHRGEVNGVLDAVVERAAVPSWIRAGRPCRRNGSRRCRREYFADATLTTKEGAAEYARRLGSRTGMLAQSVPVSHSPRKRPVYRLVFATGSQYGLCVFGDAVARARDAWRETLQSREKSDNQALFSMASLTGGRASGAQSGMASARARQDAQRRHPRRANPRDNRPAHEACRRLTAASACDQTSSTCRRVFSP